MASSPLRMMKAQGLCWPIEQPRASGAPYDGLQSRRLLAQARRGRYHPLPIRIRLEAVVVNVRVSNPIIGVIVRNSTYAQVGNYRSEVQSVDLPKRCEALGYQSQIYDEQGVSGKSLSAREQTRRALDDLRSGLIHGIGVLDVKRATRDEDCMDGRIIKQAVKQARAILVTRDKVYDFRNKSDARLWDIQALQAGWEWRDIRDTTWDGIMKRAEKPGDELMLRAVPPPGYRLVIKSFRKNGMPVRVPAKDPDEKPLIEDVPGCSRNSHRSMLSPSVLTARASGGREGVLKAGESGSHSTFRGSYKTRCTRA